jgi:hypothetical protein
MDVIFGGLITIWAIFGAIAILNIIWSDFKDSRKEAKNDED